MTTICYGELLFRPILSEDAERFFVLCNDELIATNTARIPSPYTMADANNFVDFAVSQFDAGEKVFAVCKDNEIIACAGLSPDKNSTMNSAWEVGYWVGADYRRQRVAQRSVIALSAFAFEKLGAQAVTAGFFIDNPASGDVLKKCGFKPTGESRLSFSTGRGEDFTTLRMALLPGDFVRDPAIKFSAQGN